MNGPRLVSRRSPYIPVTLAIAGRERELEIDALIDTGFDGDVIVPPAVMGGDALPASHLSWRLADDSRINAPAYVGELRIDGMTVTPVVVASLGSEAIIGRGVTNHFTVIFDHGERVIIEP